MKALVAFNRDRDSYQVPLALAERDALGALVTDYYDGADPLSIPGLKHRSCQGIPVHLAHSSRAALGLQALHRVGSISDFPHAQVARAIGRKAARVAKHDPRITHLVLYSTFAYEAFAASSPSAARILFVFHPHPIEVAYQLTRAVKQGLANSSAVGKEPELQNYSLEIDRVNRELALADLVITASSYTLESLSPYYSGPSVVVPYGLDDRTLSKPSGRSQGDVFRYLFVGAGQHRKGLLSLLLAWQRFSREHPDCLLTLVLGDADDEALKDLMPSVTVKTALDRNELDEEYTNADVFVMPSWSEGFGLAYTEALSKGCHVIGTKNSALPDLAKNYNRITIMEEPTPEDTLDALEQSLKKTPSVAGSSNKPGGDDATPLTGRSWREFRQDLWDAVNYLPTR